MPIRARCPQCATAYNLADTLAGKKVRCKKCQGVIPVPEADSEAVAVPPAQRGDARRSKTRPAPVEAEEGPPGPKRRREKDNDYNDGPPREKGRKQGGKQGSRKILFLLLSGGLLLVGLAAAGLYFLFLTGPRDPEKVIIGKWQYDGDAKPGVIYTLEFKEDGTFHMTAFGGMTTYGNGTWKVAGKKDNTITVDTTFDRTFRDSDEPRAEKLTFYFTVANPNLLHSRYNSHAGLAGPSYKRLTGDTIPNQPTENSATWQEAIDPAPSYQVPDGAGGSIPLASEFLFARSPSPFVLSKYVGAGSGSPDKYEVWDLRTVKPAGSFVASFTWPKLNYPVALSPDGTAVAGLDRTERAIEHWSVVTGQRIARLPLEPLKLAPFWSVDFVQGGDILAIGEAPKNQISCHVWDGKSPTVRRTFLMELSRVAISPNGRYLAAFSRLKKSVCLVDVTTGSQVGESMLQLRGYWTERAYAFSPDGRQLSILLSEPARVRLPDRLITLAMSDGKVVSDHKLVENLTTQATKKSAYPGPALEWLPDNSGWLLGGHLLIDAQTANLMGELPSHNRVSFPRRLLGNRHIAWVKGVADDSVLKGAVFDRLIVEERPRGW